MERVNFNRKLPCFCFLELFLHNLNYFSLAFDFCVFPLLIFVGMSLCTITSFGNKEVQRYLCYGSARSNQVLGALALTHCVI